MAKILVSCFFDSQCSVTIMAFILSFNAPFPSECGFLQLFWNRTCVDKYHTFDASPVT